MTSPAEIVVTTRIPTELLIAVKRLVSSLTGIPSEVIPNATAIKLALESFASGELAESPAHNPRCDRTQDSALPAGKLDTSGAHPDRAYPSGLADVSTSPLQTAPDDSVSTPHSRSIDDSGAHSIPLTKHDVESRLAPLFHAAIQEISSKRFDGLELTEPTPDERPLGEFKRTMPWAAELAPWSRIKDPEAYEASDAKDTALVLAYRVLYAGIPKELQSTERSRDMLNNILPAFRQAVADHPDKLPPEEVIFHSETETS